MGRNFLPFFAGVNMIRKLSGAGLGYRRSLAAELLALPAAGLTALAALTTTHLAAHSG